MTTFGYVRVSTAAQARDGYGIDAQRTAIEQAHGRDAITWIEDAGASGASLDRPGLGCLLTKISRGDTLICSKLDRLSRSIIDFCTLMERSRDEGWRLVVLDLAVDTSTAAGRFVAHIMAALAEMERLMIGERTRDGLAEAKRNGKRLGRASALPAETRAYIHRLRDIDGLAQEHIAEQLNAEGVPAPAGGEWGQQQISRVLRAGRHQG